MDVYGKIRGVIREMAGTTGTTGMRAGTALQSVIFTAVVKSVAGETCTVEIDGLPITDVRLRAVINGKSEYLLIVPKIGSYVLVADLSGGDLRQPAVIGYSEITSVNIVIGETRVEVIGAGVVINGGDLKGMVKVEAMVDWMKKLYNDLQTLKTSLATHPVAGNTAPLALVFNPSVPSPAVEDFENEKVKQ
jgi:hypothetical protein